MNEIRNSIKKSVVFCAILGMMVSCSSPTPPVETYPPTAEKSYIEIVVTPLALSTFITPSIPTETRVMKSETPIVSATPGVSAPSSVPVPDSVFDSEVSIIITTTSFLSVYHPANQKQVDFQQSDIPFQVWQMSDPCHVLIHTKDSSNADQHLRKFDLATGNNEEIFSLVNPQDAATGRFSPSVSPTGNFAMYTVFSGERYFDSAQYQDIEFVSISNTQKSVRITQNGGVWKEGGVWSPIEDQIAYTDYDEQGILQIYVYDVPLGKAIRITDFNTADRKPGPISWSPDGEYIISAFLNGKDRIADIYLIAMAKKTLSSVRLPEEVLYVGTNILWSVDGNQVILHGAGNRSYEGLFWFDITQKEQTHALLLEDTNKTNSHIISFAHPFLLSKDASIIGFYNSDTSFYYYRKSDGTFMQIPNMKPMGEGPIRSVNAIFYNPDNCKPKS